MTPGPRRAGWPRRRRPARARRSACRPRSGRRSARRAARRTTCSPGRRRSVRARGRRDVQVLQGHRLVVGQPQPADVQDVRRAAARRAATPASPRPGTGAKTVWLPGRRPRARMSAENDVAVSRWVTFGAGHERARPCRRISRCSSTSPSTARRSVIRATPRSRARSRSTGSGSPGTSPAIMPLEAGAHRSCLAGPARSHGGHGRLVQHRWAARGGSPGRPGPAR